ncbi:hypothetical protein M413DRAFT_26993 [Hebeloma cylindrosporum]|uniref:Uncharacterized protein n=1 Tax=Hebeloma cylindrosporum TaxID=76867 RepID=A0A0C3CF25_HEBCY|nr:hypothetical protein M413DRAFT_26993 [Hebeloma cylindrosporum h7]
MGRPRLYNTPEETKAAKAASSKRSYQRHRDEINEKRKKKYRKTKKKNTNAESPCSIKSRLGFCVERSESIASRLTKLCQPERASYLDKICATFMREKTMECIESHIGKVDKLQASIRKYEDAVISLSGIGAAYEGIKKVSQDVREVVGDLEEISCAALLGVDEVENMWNARKFSYQEK